MPPPIDPTLPATPAPMLPPPPALPPAPAWFGAPPIAPCQALRRTAASAGGPARDASLGGMPCLLRETPRINHGRGLQITQPHVRGAPASVMVPKRCARSFGVRHGRA